MTQALHILNFEHGRIWRILIVLEKIMEELEKSADPPDQALLNIILDYLHTYNQQLHFAKEEHLFRCLRERNPNCAATIDRLELEHQSGAEKIQELRQLLAKCVENFPLGWPQFSTALNQMIDRKRQHIQFEDRVITPMARDYLTADDWQQLDQTFKYKGDDPLLQEAVEDEFRELYNVIANYAPEPIGLGLQYPRSDQIPQAILKITGLTSHYGRIQALDDVDLVIGEGELLALVGANGAGKTTLLRTISGVQPASSGSIHYCGEDITTLAAAKRVRRGIVQVPEGRQIFGPLSVEDNLLLGGITRSRTESTETLVRMYDMFPILKQKRRQAAGDLSGGQQQMLAIARALMSRPRLLLLDEPSMGLAPLLVDEIFNTITALKQQNITIFLVEQNAYAALSIADRGYVFETGKVVLADRGPALLDNELVRKAYLGM